MGREKGVSEQLSKVSPECHNQANRSTISSSVRKC
ncbi:hypothetical protein CTA2_11415 [Colletotrichum tanaceti]|uniref:Uncharacterized protein n=1 Tax=Colletotrichum tanaceti TaxID=1306861 RepID=A0A4U6XNP7_9PEZI|nr:hypothetical protein CTA2_11415 [Colletotrichum tanaceti]TKW57393.1 hypothetical protein CTA1_355 [Colletotrichum tanaceti]